MFIYRRIFSIMVSLVVSVVLFLPGTGVTRADAKSTCKSIVPFAKKNFPATPRIDNPYLPMSPGTQRIYQGTANDGSPTSRTVIFTVTSLKKKIDGVNTVVVWDQDFDGSQLIESELTFFAQDKDGNVWNLAEYPEVYEDGQLTGAPDTWIAGLHDAVGGIHMLAHPKTGTGQYLQGYSPEIDFMDCAKVYKMGENVCTSIDCYSNVLVTSETSPLDPGGGKQIKYHAPGVGIVLITAVGDPEAETLTLTSFTTLHGEELEHVNQNAHSMNERACKTNNLYHRTC